MSRFMIFMVLVSLLLVQVGCASVQTRRPKPFAAFPYRHNGFDFKQAWKASQTPEGLAVDGVLKNIRYFRVENLQVSVSVHRKQRQVSPEETYFISGNMEREEYRDFGVMLKQVTVAPGDQLHFVISYNALDGSTPFGWTSEFTADALTGVAVLKPEETSSGD